MLRFSHDRRSIKKSQTRSPGKTVEIARFPTIKIGTRGTLQSHLKGYFLLSRNSSITFLLPRNSRCQCETLPVDSLLLQLHSYEGSSSFQHFQPSPQPDDQTLRTSHSTQVQI